MPVACEGKRKVEVVRRKGKDCLMSLAKEDVRVAGLCAAARIFLCRQDFGKPGYIRGRALSPVARPQSIPSVRAAASVL
jgi:hypothetical protein